MDRRMRTLPRWLSDKTVSRTDPVKIVQSALSETVSMSLDAMVVALDQIVGESLWRNGRHFESFGDFAIALPPAGLGNGLCGR
jgi:hypothetical protein